MSYAPLDSESLFSSAFMAGPLPWAVWTAILASKDKDGMTALNPQALARMWRIKEEEVQKAWEVHTKPDKLSKNKEHGGRRLIPTDDGRWFVVSHEQYRDKYREEKRREQLRLAKQRQREREKAEAEEKKHVTSKEEAAKAFAVANDPVKGPVDAMGEPALEFETLSKKELKEIQADPNFRGDTREMLRLDKKADREAGDSIEAIVEDIDMDEVVEPLPELPPELED